MRLFVAAELDAPIRDLIDRAAGRLREAGADVRWVARDNLHVTLKFCGELPESAPLTKELALESSRFAPFDIDLAGLGQFPANGPARVVWAGCSGDVKTLAALAGACERAAERVGVPRESRPFAAHVTIGRVKGGRNWRALADAVKARAETPIGRQRVAAVTLFRSSLGPEGSAYEALDRIALGSSPGA